VAEADYDCRPLVCVPVQPIASAPGSARAKNAAQQATECRFAPMRGNLRGAVGLFGWRQSRLRRPSWVINASHARGRLAARDRQCDRGAGVLPDGLIVSSIVVALPLFSGGNGGEMVLIHRVAVHAEARARGQPCEELQATWECEKCGLGPRVV
jgi:hypothetical protein